MTQHHLRPNDHQRESVRAELHAIIDRAIEAWPTIERQAAEMGRGYPSGGEGSGGDHGSPVENLALNPRNDPALLASQWLAQLTETRGQLRILEAIRIRCSAMKQEAIKGRINEIDTCSECGLPLGSKVKRVNNAPLHNESPGTDERGQPMPWCYPAVYRRLNRQTG